jgi:chromosome partitioning protein
VKLASIPICMVQGHEWFESRQMTGFETCRRCRSRRRKPWDGPTLSPYEQGEAPELPALPYTITVAARKGGSGKSTIALHLALAAHLRGHKVLLADTDVQRSSIESLDARDGDRPEVVSSRGAALRTLQAQAAARHAEYLIVDTPAGPGADLTLAMMISDLTLLIARPSFLDIAAAARSFYEARALGRPATILLNQAQPARGGQEAASVARAMEALRHTRLPAAPLTLHARTVYQTAVARGRSVEELGPSPAADEVAALWRHVEAMRAEALAERAVAGAAPAEAAAQSERPTLAPAHQPGDQLV